MSRRNGFCSAAVLVFLTVCVGCASAPPEPEPGQTTLSFGPAGTSTVVEPAATTTITTTEVRTFTPGTTVTVTEEPQTPPPPPKVVVKPARPGPDYVWQDGYWAWRGGQYVWAPGVWARPPVRGRAWVAGQYRRTPRGYTLVPGHWR